MDGAGCIALMYEYEPYGGAASYRRHGPRRFRSANPTQETGVERMASMCPINALAILFLSQVGRGLVRRSTMQSRFALAPTEQAQGLYYEHSNPPAHSQPPQSNVDSSTMAPTSLTASGGTGPR